MSDQDPAVSGWQAATEAHMAASTSAIGRNLQTALDQLRDEYNAELAARLRAERERDEARRVERDRVRRLMTRAVLAAVRCIPDGEIRNGCVINDGATVRERLRLAYLAVIEGDLPAPPFIVARDGGRDCESCKQEIRRGEAYQYLGVDELRHVHCPRPRKHLDAVKRERDDALAEVSRLRASNQTEATDG